jgi:predicted nucleotidyltransferase
MDTITPYPAVNTLLAQIVPDLQRTLADTLRGIYLYGSLVWGDFDPINSDIDLTVVLSTPLDDATFAALDALHTQWVHDDPQWHERIEIAYISVEALRTFKSHASDIGIISPGEPFHYKSAGADWLINWYVVQEKGRTLWGDAPQRWIPTIHKDEFIQAVRKQVGDWREWVYTMQNLPQQAYVILTMCRALYAVATGEQPSKIKAAHWAIKTYPQWATLIQNALYWRETWREVSSLEPSAIFPETVRFVHFTIDQVGAA